MRRLILVLVLLAAGVGAGPYAGYLYPAGGQRGGTVRVLVGGQYLHGVSSALLSGEGVTVRQVILAPSFSPPAGSQRKYLLGWIDAIAAGQRQAPPKPDKTEDWRPNAWWDRLGELDEDCLRLVIKDLHTKRNALQETPSIRQVAFLDLDIAAAAAPGRRELRLCGANGISAPKLFYVDVEPHLAEPVYVAPDKPRPESPLVEIVPCVLDGQIMPGETDAFRIFLQAGQAYSFAVQGRSLLPFIGDAVPGHFQPVLTLLDPAGRPAGFADDEYFWPDPVLRVKPAATGVHVLRIADNLYRGREDFVYRIEVSQGWRPYAGGGNPFPGREAMPEAAAAKQCFGLNAVHVMAGTISGAGEQDVFRFRGRQGEIAVLDLAARRVGSPLDGILRIRQADGVLVAEIDDAPASLNVGLCLQPADPACRLVLPADGEYSVAIGDVTGAGGADYRYWLRLGRPVPDFNVYTAKSGLNIGPGGTESLKLHVVREDGFKGDIRMVGENVRISGQTVFRGDEKTLTVQVKNVFLRGMKPCPVILFAEAEIDGGVVRKPVIPADVFMQAFAYDHLLPTSQLVLWTLNRPDDGVRPRDKGRDGTPRPQPKQEVRQKKP